MAEPAEPAEPRTETKGNAGQQSTRRAQDRGSVSQRWNAYGKPHGKGRRRGSPRFCTKSALPLPRTMFYAMKRDAARGVDDL
jgi:RNA-directed DNA polymerase